MFETCAYLVQDILQDLGLPLELLHPEHVMKGMAASFALRGLARQQSPEGRLTKVIPVNLGARDSLLSDAPDMAVPLYIERRVGVTPFETWEWIPPIGKDGIEEAYARGDLRCAFYREDPTELWHVVLTYNPLGGTHRLNYYTDPAARALLGDPLPLPTRFAHMFKYDTLINIIPPIQMRNGKLDEGQQINSATTAGLNSILAHAQNELTKEDGWNDLWKSENTKDKATRGRMMRPIIGRGRNFGSMPR